MAIERLNHFTVVTEDLDVSIEFYQSVLGLAPGWRPPFPSRVGRRKRGRA